MLWPLLEYEIVLKYSVEAAVESDAWEDGGDSASNVEELKLGSEVSIEVFEVSC